MGSHQAVWDIEEKVLTYRNTELCMDQILHLLLSEFREAQDLLYSELMFAAQHLSQMKAWALKDNLDVDVYGWHFGQHQENAELLRPLQGALSKVIQGSKMLRDSFLMTAANGSKSWREKAISQYEAVVDEFQKRMLVLVHMASGQPLREKELLSVMWRNMQRRRNIFLKYGLVMFYTTYHKG